jgi:hypothetical protein
MQEDLMGTLRYVGLDAHKPHVTVAAVNEQQELLLPARNVSIQRFFDWAQEHLLSSDDCLGSHQQQLGFP